MTRPETFRTFIAVPLSDAILAQLADVQRKLRRTCPEGAVTWVKPESVHLTLFFLGEILPERLQPVQEALTVVARNVKPFTFNVRGVGAFPNVSRPRVVWVGLEEPTGQLALLYHAVNEAMEKVGFRPEDRPFSPHLTVGRIHRRASSDEARDVGKAVGQIEVGLLGEVPVEEIIFFRSILKSSGAEYTPLATFRLGE